MNAPFVLAALGVLLSIAGACIATMNQDWMWTAIYAALGVLSVLTMRAAMRRPETAPEAPREDRREDDPKGRTEA